MAAASVLSLATVTVLYASSSDSFAAGQVLTVAQDGSGMYSSIQDAANAATPGDTVLVSGGTYKGNLDIRVSGAPGSPITFQNKPGEKVVIDGAGVTGQGVITVSNHSHLVLSGLDVTNSQAHGVYVVRSNDITIKDCEVSHSRDGGIVLIGNDRGASPAKGAVVDNCDVFGNNSIGRDAANEAITINNYDGFEVKNNRVYDNGEEGIDAKYEATNGLIHNNYLENNNGPNIYIDSANNIDIYSNIVKKTADATKAGIGVAVEDYSDTRAVYELNIFNNVIYDNGLAGVGFWAESSGSFSDIKIVNNTMWGNARGDIHFASNYSVGGTNVIQNNIMLSPGGDLANTGSFNVGNNLMGVDIASVGLTDMANGDARLQSGSVAIDGGAAEFAPSTDFDGGARPSGGAHDIGAFEFGAAPSTNSTGGSSSTGGNSKPSSTSTGGNSKPSSTSTGGSSMPSTNPTGGRPTPITASTGGSSTGGSSTGGSSTSGGSVPKTSSSTSLQVNCEKLETGQVACNIEIKVELT